MSSNKINFSKEYGTIRLIDGENSCAVILDRFIGSFDSISSDCAYLTIVLKSDSQINSDICLNVRDDKLDTLIIKGEGALGLGKHTLKATSVEIQTDVICEHIEGNVVKISGCKVLGETDPDPVIIPVDKSELQQLVDAILSGIGDYDISKYKISEDGLDVLTTEQWITPEAKETFDNALAEAQRVLGLENATQGIVDQALDNLSEAFDNLNPQWGKKIVTDKSKLEEAIIQANMALGLYSSSIDGYDIPNDVQWIDISEYHYLSNRIEIAQNIFDDTTVDQVTVDNEVQELLYAISNLSPCWGKQEDPEIASAELKQRLYDKIQECLLLLNEYKPSIDGHDIYDTEIWVTTFTYDNLQFTVNVGQEIYRIETSSTILVENIIRSLDIAIDSLNPQYGLMIDPRRYEPIPIPIINSIIQGNWEEISEQEDEAILLYRLNDILSGNRDSLTYSELRIADDMIDAIIDGEWVPRTTGLSSSVLGKINSLSSNLISPKFKLKNNLFSNFSDIESFIYAKGHVWIIDSILSISEGFDNGIVSPYILIDNSTCNIQANDKAMNTSNKLSIEHCIDVETSDTKFISSSLVVDDEGNPKEFIYDIIRNEDGSVKQIASRRKLYGYNVETFSYYQNGALVSGNENIPAQLATPYDLFKHATQYTNVDLHRWINQNGVILKGLGRNYISNELLDLITNDLWSGDSIEWEAIPDEIINVICASMFEYCCEITLVPEDLSIPGIYYIDTVWSKSDDIAFSFISSYVTTNKLVNKPVDYAYGWPKPENVEYQEEPVQNSISISNIDVKDDEATVTFRIEIVEQNWASFTAFISYRGVEFELQSYDIEKEETEETEIAKYKFTAKLEHLYDHPHTSDPMDLEILTEILNDTYEHPKENGFELDEVRSRKYELGIYSLNSYRTTDIAFYEENSPISEDIELP